MLDLLLRFFESFVHGNYGSEVRGIVANGKVFSDNYIS
jgi:hypothetical protein